MTKRALALRELIADSLPWGLGPLPYIGEEYAIKKEQEYEALVATAQLDWLPSLMEMLDEFSDIVEPDDPGNLWAITVSDFLEKIGQTHPLEVVSAALDFAETHPHNCAILWVFGKVLYWAQESTNEYDRAKRLLEERVEAIVAFEQICAMNLIFAVGVFNCEWSERMLKRIIELRPEDEKARREVKIWFRQGSQMSAS